VLSLDHRVLALQSLIQELVFQEVVDSVDVADTVGSSGQFCGPCPVLQTSHETSSVALPSFLHTGKDSQLKLFPLSTEIKVLYQLQMLPSQFGELCFLPTECRGGGLRRSR